MDPPAGDTGWGAFSEHAGAAGNRCLPFRNVGRNTLPPPPCGVLAISMRRCAAAALGARWCTGPDLLGVPARFKKFLTERCERRAGHPACAGV